MKRASSIVIFVSAVLGQTALPLPSASAGLPTLLPTTAAFNISSGADTLGSGVTAIQHAKDTGKGAGTGEKTASFSIVYEGSKDQLGRTCTGLSDTTAGNVTVQGTADIRYASSTKKTVAVAFLIAAVHFSCGTMLIIEEGCVAGEIAATTYNMAVKEVAIKLEVEKGDNKLVKIENIANTGEEACLLKAALNDGESTLWSHSGAETFKEFTKAKGATSNEVEVMA